MDHDLPSPRTEVVTDGSACHCSPRSDGVRIEESLPARAEMAKVGKGRGDATGAAVEQFLPVLDNFQLALKSTGTLEQLKGGVELIAKQMEEALRSLQVQPVETVGAVFDPRFHEALGQVETAEVPDGHVAEEVRRGYRIRERLLRPALVRVATNPGQTQV